MKRATSAQVREDHHPDIFPVAPRDHYVTNERREMVEDPCAQRANTDPSAGGEFEVLGKAAIKDKSLIDVGRVNKTHGITELVKAFLVEGRLRGFWLAPIARHDVRTSNARFQFASARNEFELNARNGNPDMARAIGFPSSLNGHGRRFGGAESGDHDYPLTASFERKLAICIPNWLRQTGCGVKQELQPAEEFFAKLSICPEGRQQILIALWNVEVNRGSYIAQIPNCLIDKSGPGLAAIDVKGSTIVEGDADIVVSPECVIPGKPIQKNWGFILQEAKDLSDHLLVGAEHAMRVDDGFR